MDSKINGLILVTRAAGRVGAVGRTVVELLRQRGLPVRALVVAKMNAPADCAQPALRLRSPT